MRIISQLARKEKGEDDFGMRDEDWDVYKAISKDGDSDSDVENEKLLELEEILRHHDPAFEEPQIVQEGAAESYQVRIDTLKHIFFWVILDLFYYIVDLSASTPTHLISKASYRNRITPYV